MGKGTSGPDILASNSNTAAADNKTTAETASCAPRCLPPESSLLPTIIVFDLDDCLWTPEMHELSGLPSIAVEGPLDPNDAESTLGTVGMKVPSRRSRSTRRGGGGFDWGSQDGEEIVELYPGARHVLRQLVINPIYKNVQIAVASTSLAPSYSMACINGLEIVEDVSLRSMLSYIQVGRDGKLSTRKTSHFQLLHEESGGVPYSEMLFFGKRERGCLLKLEQSTRLCSSATSHHCI